MHSPKNEKRSAPAGSLAEPLGLLGMLAMFFLTGCTTVGPNYRPPRPKMPVVWGGTAAAAAKPAGTGELARWWTGFHDPLLDSLVHRSVAANQDMKIAAARIREARAQYRLTTGAAYPTVGVAGAYSNIKRSGNTTTSSGAGITQDLFQTSFDAGWELDLFGGVRRAAQAADARLAVAVENRRDVLISLEAEVALNYLELRGSQQRLATAQKNLAIQEKTVALTRGRQESGLGTDLEVAQAETQFSLTAAQIPPLKNSAAQAIYRLSLLLGQPPLALNAELSPPEPLPTQGPRLPKTLPSDLLRRRPDIRSAERELAATTADIGVATAALFPQFSLTALLGLQSANLSELLSASSRYWTVGPAVTWSLFNGGRVRANIDLSKARRDEAEATYEKTVLIALNEVQTDLVALAREKETRRALAEAVASGRRAVDLALGRYRAGLAGFLDVLQSEQALYQSQDQLVQSDQQLALTRVALFKALGGGWQVSPHRAENGQAAGPTASAASFP